MSDTSAQQDGLNENANAKEQLKVRVRLPEPYQKKH